MKLCNIWLHYLNLDCAHIYFEKWAAQISVILRCIFGIFLIFDSIPLFLRTLLVVILAALKLRHHFHPKLCSALLQTRVTSHLKRLQLHNLLQNNNLKIQNLKFLLAIIHLCQNYRYTRCWTERNEQVATYKTSHCI